MTKRVKKLDENEDIVIMNRKEIDNTLSCNNQFSKTHLFLKNINII